MPRPQAFARATPEVEAARSALPLGDPARVDADAIGVRVALRRSDLDRAEILARSALQWAESRAPHRAEKWTPCGRPGTLDGSGLPAG